MEERQGKKAHESGEKDGVKERERERERERKPGGVIKERSEYGRGRGRQSRGGKRVGRWLWLGGIEDRG